MQFREKWILVSDNEVDEELKFESSSEEDNDNADLDRDIDLSISVVNAL